jgi:predicted NBD/HSP70 family sugar kinase
MKQTGDLNLVKKINKSLVLDVLRHHSPVSRSRIAQLTGLTKATVSNLVNEFVEHQLAYEVGAGVSSGGRKPMMLLFHQVAGYAIGVDLGVNYIAAILTDLRGVIVEEYRISHTNTSLEDVIHAVKATIREMIRRTPTCPFGVIGIGIGIPGICDEHGTIGFAPNLGWSNIPLQHWIEEEFQLPVVIDNEANAGAVGEQQFTQGEPIDHLVYLSMSMGIGAGLIFKGELYRGATGFSGELGHMSVMHNGPKCNCGNLGCWELYASEHALLDKAQRIFSEPGLTLEALMAKAEQRNPQALELFNELGRNIGVGLVSVIHSFNPQHIIIGGRLAAAQKWIEHALTQVIQQRTMTYPLTQLQVQFSQLETRSTLLGACFFVISKFIASTKVTQA